MSDNSNALRGTVERLEEKDIIVKVPNDPRFASEWRPGTPVYVYIEGQRQQQGPSVQPALVVMMPEQKKPDEPKKEKQHSQVFQRL